MELTIEDIENVQKQIDELKAKLETDKFKDLKKAYSEGAIIEYANSVNEYRWASLNDTRPDWTAPKYRIKDNISIKSWNKHKDLIKQYWGGAKVQVRQGMDFTDIRVPLWEVRIDCEYRVKPTTWKLPECEDGSEWTALTGSIHKGYSSSKFTKAGRRRATKALAERCAKASKQRDLLEAYRDYLDPEWKDVENKTAYCIDYNCLSKSYNIFDEEETRSLGGVYGSEETMQKICDALNNEEISFD